MTDPIAPVWCALRRSASVAAVSIERLAADATPWWSATFAGHRLTVTLIASGGAALDAWLAALPELDLPIPDRLVADCAVDRVADAPTGARVDLSLLLLDVE